MGDPSNKKHNRLYNWKDLNAADIKLFLVHIIIMSLVWKAAVHSYLVQFIPHTLFWKTPFTEQIPDDIVTLAL